MSNPISDYLKLELGASYFYWGASLLYTSHQKYLSRKASIKLENCKYVIQVTRANIDNFTLPYMTPHKYPCHINSVFKELYIREKEILVRLEHLQDLNSQLFYDMVCQQKNLIADLGKLINESQWPAKL